MSRYDLDLFSDPLHTSSGGEGDDEAWMLSYLDVMTLLIAFFVLLLTLSEPRIHREEVLADGNPSSVAVAQGAESTHGLLPTTNHGAGLLPGSTGLSPAQHGLLPTAGAESAPGLSADDYQQRFGALEDSLNSLALQGVDATPGREGLTLRIADNLLFASGDADLSHAGMQLINQLQQVLDNFSGEISIEGHTDNVPIRTVRFPSNWELSSARAISVLRYLESGGLQAGRMRAVGYADTRPLQANDHLTGRAANRRVELILRAP